VVERRGALRASEGPASGRGPGNARRGERLVGLAARRGRQGGAEGAAHEDADGPAGEGCGVRRAAGGTERAIPVAAQRRPAEETGKTWVASPGFG